MEVLTEVEHRLSHDPVVHDGHEGKDALQVKVADPTPHYLRIAGVAAEVLEILVRRPGEKRHEALLVLL
jgi:hypothetical protein